VASVFFGWRMLAPHETPTQKVKVDIVGLLLLVFWVGALQTMLDIGKTHDWFASPLVNLLLVASIVGFIAFCIWEWTAEHPIVDIRVFKNKSLAICTVTIAVVIGLYFGSAVLTPLWLQTNMGYNASWAGSSMAFSGMLAVVMAPIVGRLVTKFDPRILLTFSLSGLTLIMLWRTTFTMDMTFWQISEPLLVQGMFMPFFFLPLMTVALGTLAPKDIPNGAAMLTFVRTVAGAVATSLMLTTWEDAAVSARANLVGGLHPQALGPVAAGANATPILERLVQNQAVMIATNHMFMICAVAMALAAAGVWLTPKIQPRRGVGGGGH
jgi:MFS transporter, DHA2 family, multidrug resistance protein